MKLKLSKPFFTFSFILFTSLLMAQTQQDTMYALITHEPVVIDGAVDDACWETATWFVIDQVWLPNVGAKMDEGDFEGRFKLAWDSAYLYLLVEVIDDSLSDDHADPLENWWDDDCVEIFIDEDRSKGWHQNDHNAFAYHVSMFYDVIDMDANGGVNYKENLEVKMDTVGENTYQWEFAIKQYTKSFNPSSPENSRVYLTPNKIMGFSIAYCDNDETTSRENFIGNIIMSEAKKNVNYQTADYFGTLQLIDPEYVDNTSSETFALSGVSCYPNPFENQISIELGEARSAHVEVFNVAGVKVLDRTVDANATINTEKLNKGIYFVSIQSDLGTSVVRLAKNL